MNNQYPKCVDDSCDQVHCRICHCHTIGNTLVDGCCQDCFDTENEEINRNLSNKYIGPKVLSICPIIIILPILFFSLTNSIFTQPSISVPAKKFIAPQKLYLYKINLKHNPKEIHEPSIYINEDLMEINSLMSSKEEIVQIELLFWTEDGFQYIKGEIHLRPFSQENPLNEIEIELNYIRRKEC